MTKQVQRRRGTATQHTSFTGAEGELSVNTTNKSVHVHDNVTAGGFEAARADMDNVTSSSILTAAGITATTTELNYVDGVTSAIQTQLDGKAGTASPTFTGTLTTANLTATGTTTLAGASTSADITFGDNDKAIFGASSDLQIYHDGTNSYIDEAAAGDLYIRAFDRLKLNNYSDNAAMLNAKSGAEVELYYNGGLKLATTSTGVDITGTLTSDGLTVDNGVITIGQESVYDAFINSPESLYINIDSDNTQTGRKFQIGANAINTSGAKVFTANDNGDISFYEDTGTTAKFFWDASAERLGIGTSSPSAALDIVAPANTEPLQIKATTDGYNYITHKNAAGTDVAYTGLGGGAAVTTGAVTDYAIRATANLLFGAGSNTERMRIDSYGGLTVKAAASSATTAVFGGTNLVNGITAVPSSAGTPFTVGRDTGSGRSAHFGGHLKFDSGYGIDFSATANGSGTTTSEVFDDYEEGTWTPALSYGGTSATLTSSTGQYIKIGRLVHVWIQIQVSNLNSGSGSIELSGLPFGASGNMVYYHGNIQGNAEMNLPTGAGSVMPYVTSGTSTARFLYMTNSTHNDVNSSHFPAPITIYGQMTYSSA